MKSTLGLSTSFATLSFTEADKVRDLTPSNDTIDLAMVSTQRSCRHITSVRVAIMYRKKRQ